MTDGILRDKPGRRTPCLHERAFAGQRTANGYAVSFRGIRSTNRLFFPVLQHIALGIFRGKIIFFFYFGQSLFPG